MKSATGTGAVAVVVVEVVVAGAGVTIAAVKLAYSADIVATNAGMVGRIGKMPIWTNIDAYLVPEGYVFVEEALISTIRSAG